MVDNEVEFVDEDRYTTVTVEAVQVSRDGLHKITQQDGRDGTESDTPAAAPAPPSTDQRGKRIWTKERPGGPKKKKKKKFRYESKAERKVTRYKERSGNKSKAKARRE